MDSIIKSSTNSNIISDVVWNFDSPRTRRTTNQSYAMDHKNKTNVVVSYDFDDRPRRTATPAAVVVISAWAKAQKFEAITYFSHASS